MGGKTKTQINYYFDSDDFILHKNGISLRIRESKDEYSLEVKIVQSANKDENFRQSKEYIIKTDRATVNGFITDNENILSFNSEITDIIAPWIFSENNIKYIGKLETCRTKYNPIQGINPVEIDRSFYLDVEDFELEWEVNTQTEINIIRDWIIQIGIPIRKSEYGKYGRFINRLQMKRTKGN